MKKSDNISREEATANLLASFSTPRSRRALLKGAAAATGVVAAGAGMLSALPAQAMALDSVRKLRPGADSIATILTVARTAEQLAVTFYSNGLKNASQLGISGDELSYVKAALVEEQIHQQFFAANGGGSLADTFSFPKGAQTFSDLATFIETQQQLEGVFDSAFLAAIVEFAQLGRPDLAQIAGQVACIEAEHRALGRVIGKLSPADNWAFTPVLIGTVGEAPALVQKAGYLSPTSGNSYTYHAVSTADAGVVQRKPFSASNTMLGNG
jgi:Ferritin-like domain